MVTTLSAASVFPITSVFGQNNTFTGATGQLQQQIQQQGAAPSTQTTTGTTSTTTAADGSTTTTKTLGANATTYTTDTGNSAGTTTTGNPSGGITTISVSIVPGSSSLTDTAFSPNPVEVSVGSTVTWTNDDTQPHTVVSGANAQQSGEFDSSPNFNPLIAPGATFEHTFTTAGEFPYYCALHPNMVGTVIVAPASSSQSTAIGNTTTTISTSGENDTKTTLDVITNPLQDLFGGGDQTAGDGSSTTTGSSTSASSPSSSGSSRCPDGYHRSPSGDCERVTDTRGMPRCPNGYHRSPDGDCEYVG